MVCSRYNNVERVCCVRSEQAALQQKLAQIEKKIIVGGENLLEKAEEQEKLLEESARELEERQKKAESLRRALEEKEVNPSLVMAVDSWGGDGILLLLFFTLGRYVPEGV